MKGLINQTDETAPYCNKYLETFPSIRNDEALELMLMVPVTRLGQNLSE